MSKIYIGSVFPRFYECVVAVDFFTTPRPSAYTHYE